MDDVEESMLDSEVGLERKPRKSTMEKTDGEVRYSSIEAGERSLMEINVKKLSVYFDEIEGSEDAVGGSDFFMDEKMREKAEADTVLSSLKVENKSSLFISLSSEGYEKTETAMLHPIPDIIEAHEQNGVVHESKEDLGKTDVERVLEEQETHDLYCPNCRSCITKRVILRKRKRTVFDSPYVEKPEIEEEPYFLDAAHTTDLPDRKEPKVFRCLQCFEFFVVTGSSLNCISLFTEWWKGKTPGTEIPTTTPTVSVYVPQVIGNTPASVAVLMKPATSQSISPAAWEIPTTPTVSFSVPQVIAPYTPTGQTGTTPDSVVPTKPATFQNTSSAAWGLSSVSEAESVKPVTFPSVSPSAETPTIPTSSIFVSQVTGAESVEPATLISISPSTGLPSVSVAESVKPVTFPSVSPSAEIPTIPTSSISVSQVTGAESVESATLISISPSTGAKPVQPATLISISPSTGLPSVSVAEPVKPLTFPSVSPSAEIPTIPTSSISVSQVTGAESVEPATVMSISPSTGAEPVQPATLISISPSTGAESVHPATLISISPSTGAKPVQPETLVSISPSTGGAEIVVGQATRSWDVLKSIVYGGLVESIASLGVVSSAAGGDADTLNIIALGLANLIGGLFMIAHNLWELRIERQDRGRTTNQEDKINRYEQTLGNVNNFRLHATMVVLAYIVSGVIPPITYGFSFRKSDNKDYKLIAVAVASLFCTALLAVGKAHIQKVSRSHYLKVVLYYVTLGLLASGLSYATGNLVKKLLVKLGFVSSAATPTSDFGFLGSGLMTSEWASY